MISSITASGQTYNYDESKAGNYVLPELLISADGARVKNRKDWEKIRRPEILQLYTDQVYGRIPGKPAGPAYSLYGKNGLSTPFPPATDSPVQGAVDYQRRSGKHDVTLYDWQRYIAWADRYLKKTRSLTSVTPDR